MKFRYLMLVTALIAAAPQYLSAQGFFQAFGIPSSAAASGQTEVLGSIQIALQQGPPALADTLVIDVSPFTITNASASDISVTVAGNIVTGAVTIDSTAQRVDIPVNAGATSGSFRVDGIRVALAGTNSSSVTAHLSWAAQQNVIETTAVMVVNNVQSALVTSPMTDTFQVFNNTVTDNTATISLQEGFADAFVNGSKYGENSPTEIRIRVTDFPAGLQMLFPASITAKESAATLTTLQGGSVTLPQGDGTTTVTYVFNGASDSATTVESFDISFTVSAQGSVQLLQPTIDVSLAPIGAATPSSAFPSTSIPRYADDEENVLAGTSHIVTQTLYWSGIDNTLRNRLSIVNPGSYTSNVTLTALDQNGVAISGNNIANPVRQTLGANQSLDSALTDLFGISSNMATVRIDSTGPAVLALGTAASDSGMASIPLSNNALTNFAVPVFESGGSIALFNSGPLPVSGTLALEAVDGSSVGSKTISLNSMAETSFNIQDLFGTQTSGQITGAFSAPIIAVESFGNNGTFNLAVSYIPPELSSFYAPLFIAGGGNETDFSFTDSTSSPVTLNLQPYAAGSSSAGMAQSITLQPSEQFAQTASELFGFQGLDTTGYVQIQPSLVTRGLFGGYPQITAYARIHTGQAAATIPVFAIPEQNVYILSSGVSAGNYQGISIANPNSSAATVGLQVLNTAGSVVESANLTLAPGQVVAKLTTELFTTEVPEKSVIRITGSLPIIAGSAFGTLANDQLRFVLGQ